VKVRVYPQRCQGHTLRAMIAPRIFQLSDIDGSFSVVCEVVPPDQEEPVREAAHSCPEQAILVEETQNGSTKRGIDHEKVREAMP
jgi:ferredoxin